MNLKDKLYFALPVYLQNVLISLYGLKIRKNRYGNYFAHKYEELIKSQYWDKSRYLDFQEKELKSLVDYAKKNVSYYKKTLRDIEIRHIDDIKKLPIIDRERVRKNYHEFFDGNLNKKKFSYINTSGSTGTPLRIPVFHEGRQANYAFFERAKRWAGISERSRGVTFAGRVFISPKARKPPFWRYNYFNNNLQCSSYHLSEESIFHYHKAICDFKPEFLDSYPSSAHIFANLAKKKDLRPIKLRAVITSSETLLEYQRKAIEDFFECKVFDQYGNAEQASFICQCESNSYHVNQEYGIIEFLNPDTQEDARPGEFAELVCTGFTNLAMPMIRYKIGDIGVYSDKACQCGRQLPVVEAIIGRLDDLIVSNDGTMVGRLDPVFKGLGETIIESQIIQIDYDNLILKIVRGLNYSELDGTKTIQEIHKRTNYKFKIAIHYVDAIPRGRNGKFRSVISLLDKKAVLQSAKRQK